MEKNFEEKSGLVTCATGWGNWGQTIDEIQIEINIKEGTPAKIIKCIINSKDISVNVGENTILKGPLFDVIVKDESIWTLEDRKLLRIILHKSHREASNCWKSLFSNGEYAADILTIQQMEKKLTLERFQKENPGFDFSKADVSGNYQGGGPKFPSK